MSVGAGQWSKGVAFVNGFNLVQPLALLQIPHFCCIMHSALFGIKQTVGFITVPFLGKWSKGIALIVGFNLVRP